jgi:hypothetical protein
MTGRIRVPDNTTGNLIHSSPNPVSGQCDKGMLLGELCPVQLGYDMA